MLERQCLMDCVMKEEGEQKDEDERKKEAEICQKKCYFDGKVTSDILLDEEFIYF